MAVLAEAARARARAELPLPLSEQISRDARTRLLAAAAVILVHAAYPPGHAALAALPPGGQRAASLAFALVVAFPVNTFVLLSFLGLARRLEAGAAPGQLLRATARRLVPAHLFWTAVYLGARAAATRTLPAPRAVIEAVALGTGAAHLYFTPLLLALTAAAPVLWWLARRPAAAVAGAAAIAVAAVALRVVLGTGTPWARALPGVLGFGPFAVAGLALARAWRGTAPPAARRRRVLSVSAAAGVLAAVSLAVALARAGFVQGLAPHPAAWVGGNVYALAVPLALLAIGGAASRTTVRLASWSLGIYFVHPLFVQALRVTEARIPALAGAEVPLVLPNAGLAAVLSVAAVALLVRTPLRRMVG